MRLARQGLVFTLFLSLATAGQAAAARKPNPFLVQAKVLYQGLEFEQCLKRLEQATRWKNSSRAEQVEIELYSGLCTFSLGNEPEARRYFSVALELDPKVELPPYSSPRLVTFFDDLAQRETARADEPETPPQPPAPPSAAPASDSPRVVALQPASPPEQPALIQKATAPRPKSLFFPALLSGASVAATGGAVYFGLHARAEEARANSADTFYEDALVSRRQAQQSASITNIAIGVAATAAAGALLSYALQ
jgi:hypothetical protein